jgi:hypothetical protein
VTFISALRLGTLGAIGARCDARVCEERIMGASCSGFDTAGADLALGISVDLRTDYADSFQGLHGLRGLRGLDKVRGSGWNRRVAARRGAAQPRWRPHEHATE